MTEKVKEEKGKMIKRIKGEEKEEGEFREEKAEDDDERIYTQAY